MNAPPLTAPCILCSATSQLVAIRKMMVACKDKESRYLVRGLQGKLRIGLAERTVLVALAQAVALTPPTASPPVMDLRTTMPPEKVTAALEASEAAVKQAHSEMPSYDEIIPALLRGGIEEMKKTCTLRPGNRMNCGVTAFGDVMSLTATGRPCT